MLDVQTLAKYNDMQRYILSVVNVISIYLHLIPVKTKSGSSVAWAFRSIFHDDELHCRVWLRTDKGKEFLNKQFQGVLLEEGIHLLVCEYRDVKCAVVERAHRAIRDTLQILYI